MNFDWLEEPVLLDGQRDGRAYWVALGQLVGCHAGQARGGRPFGGVNNRVFLAMGRFNWRTVMLLLNFALLRNHRRRLIHFDQNCWQFIIYNFA